MAPFEAILVLFLSSPTAAFNRQHYNNHPLIIITVVVVVVVVVFLLVVVVVVVDTIGQFEREPGGKEVQARCLHLVHGRGGGSDWPDSDVGPQHCHVNT